MVELSVESFFLLLNAAFLTLNFLAPVGKLLFAFGSEAMNLVLTLKDYFLLLAFYFTAKSIINGT